MSRPTDQMQQKDILAQKSIFNHTLNAQAIMLNPNTTKNMRHGNSPKLVSDHHHHHHDRQLLLSQFQQKQHDDILEAINDGMTLQPGQEQVEPIPRERKFGARRRTQIDFKSMNQPENNKGTNMMMIDGSKESAQGARRGQDVPLHLPASSHNSKSRTHVLQGIRISSSKDLGNQAKDARRASLPKNQMRRKEATQDAGTQHVANDRLDTMNDDSQKDTNYPRQLQKIE